MKTENGIRIPDIQVDLEARAQEARRVLLLAGTPEWIRRADRAMTECLLLIAVQEADEVLCGQYPDVDVYYMKSTFGRYRLETRPRFLLSHLDNGNANGQHQKGSDK